MNYDSEINKIVIVVAGDKAIVQPWRNKAKSRLEEAQAFIRMGQTTSTENEDQSVLRFPTPKAAECVCREGMPPRKDCPLHGGV